ncbi:MAG: NAD(P)-binding protein [Aliidongia sp.]
MRQLSRPRRRRVLVLEAADRVGGAAITRDFAPGFRVSACAHLLHQMPQAMIDELDLARHGLEFAATALPTHALALDGKPLRLDATAIGERSAADGAAYGPFIERLGKFAAHLLPLLQAAPPRLANGGLVGSFRPGPLGWQIRSLGRRDMRELLRILGMNVYDLLEEQFEIRSRERRTRLRCRARQQFRTAFAGTVLTLLYRLAAQTAAGRDPLSQPKGGMGAVTAALAGAARAAGARDPDWRPSSPHRRRERPGRAAWCWPAARRSRLARSSPMPTRAAPSSICWDQNISIPLRAPDRSPAQSRPGRETASGSGRAARFRRARPRRPGRQAADRAGTGLSGARL